MDIEFASTYQRWTGRNGGSRKLSLTHSLVHSFSLYPTLDNNDEKDNWTSTMDWQGAELCFLPLFIYFFPVFSFLILIAPSHYWFCTLWTFHFCSIILDLFESIEFQYWFFFFHSSRCNFLLNQFPPLLTARLDWPGSGVSITLQSNSNRRIFCKITGLWKLSVRGTDSGELRHRKFFVPLRTKHENIDWFLGHRLNISLWMICIIGLIPHPRFISRRELQHLSSCSSLSFPFLNSHDRSQRSRASSSHSACFAMCLEQLEDSSSLAKRIAILPRR